MPKIIYKNKDGKRLPSVTTIIGILGANKRPLMHWAWTEGLEGRDYRETADKAATVGTIAHEMVEMDIKGEEFDIEKYDDIPTEDMVKATTAFQGWLAWKKLVDFKVIETEHQLVSERHQFGGMLDIAAVKDKTCIVDLKTGGLYPEHLIQIAGYSILWDEVYPENPIEEYYLLKIDKEHGGFAYHFWPQGALFEAQIAFMNLLILYNLHKKLRKMI